MPGAGGSLPNFWDQGSAPFSPRHFATLQTRAGGREGAQGFPQTPIHAPEPTAGPKDEAPGSKRRERRVAWLRKVGEHTQAPTWIKYQQNTQTEPTCLCSRLCQPVVAAASAEMTWLRPRGRGAPMRLTMPTPAPGAVGYRRSGWTGVMPAAARGLAAPDRGTRFCRLFAELMGARGFPALARVPGPLSPSPRSSGPWTAHPVPSGIPRRGFHQSPPPPLSSPGHLPATSRLPRFL